jgi:GTP pyrophosphokinase
VEDLYFAVALGDISPSQVARALHEVTSPKAEAEPHKPLLSAAKPPKPDRGLTIEGVGNLLTQLARCCQPVAGDPIAGFLTRGRGVSIHREDCPSMQHLAARHAERVLPVEWGRRGGQSYQVDVLVRGIDRKWLLKDITNVIGVANAYVLGVNSRVDPDTSKAELRFSLRVNDFQQLGELLGKMAAVPGVSDVRRTP